MRPSARFIIKFIIVHLVTYILTGVIAFSTFMKDLYTGPDALFASFLVTPSDPALWSAMLTRMLPIQLIRGLLLGMVFYSLSKSLKQMSLRRRFIMFMGFYFLVGFLAGPAIGPGTLEGLVYMRPEYSPTGHFRVFCEMALQSVMLSAWMAKWMRTTPIETEESI
ncbi:MAG: hypothetical protein AAGC88_11455 [Bacteroidota bacterium]